MTTMSAMAGQLRTPAANQRTSLASCTASLFPVSTPAFGHPLPPPTRSLVGSRALRGWGSSKCLTAGQAQGNVLREPNYKDNQPKHESAGRQPHAPDEAGL